MNNFGKAESWLNALKNERPCQHRAPKFQMDVCKVFQNSSEGCAGQRAGNACHRPVATETACATVVTAVKW